MKPGIVNKQMFICLKVSSLAAIIGTVVTLEICRRPFGPKMCEDLCQRTAGCTSYVFSASSLSCYIGDVHSGNKQKCVPDESQVTHIPTKQLSCPRDSTVIQSRTKGLQCVKALWQETQRNTVQTKKKWTRIILMQTFSSGLGIREIFIYNQTVKKHPKAFAHMYVYTVAYIPSFKKIILSTQGGIMSAPPDMSTYTSLNSSLNLYDMAADDNKGMVFMLNIKHSTSLIMMNMINSTFEVLYNFKMIARSLAVKAKQNTCFVGVKNEIMSLTYVGTHLKIHKTGQRMRVFSMDTDNNELYFLEGKRLKKMSLSDNEVTTTKEKSVQDIIYDDNVLYIVTTGGVKIVSKNTSVAIYKRRGLARYRMFLLP